MLGLVAFVAEELEGVLADRLEQAEAWHVVEIGSADEVGVDESCERVQVRGADLLRGFERGATGKDGKPGEHGALGRCQEPDAPIERLSERLLSRRKIARATGEDGKPVAQPLTQRRQRQGAHAARGQLNRQREPIDSCADVGDRGLILRSQAESRSESARSLLEELDSGFLLERGDREDVLAREVENGTAGDEKREPWRTSNQR